MHNAVPGPSRVRSHSGNLRHGTVRHPEVFGYATFQRQGMVLHNGITCGHGNRIKEELSMDTVIRIATEADSAFVHSVYGHYVYHSNATFSTVNPSVESYREKIRHTLETYPFYICETDGKPCGFTYGAQIRPHEAYQWDVEGTIYLSPDAPRRAGLGSKLYGQLLDTLQKQGFKTVYGVITDLNEPSLALHRALGFTEAGHFRNMGYKNGLWLGVIWMQKTIGSFGGVPDEPIPFAQWRERGL